MIADSVVTLASVQNGCGSDPVSQWDSTLNCDRWEWKQQLVGDLEESPFITLQREQQNTSQVYLYLVAVSLQLFFFKKQGFLQQLCETLFYEPT